MEQINFNSYIKNTKNNQPVKYKPALAKMPYDSLELSTKKTKENKKSKNNILKFLAGAAALGVTAGFLIAKNKTTQLKQLAENIEFKKASTIEEALDYTKKVLHIKNVDGFDSDSLDVLNWFNEGMTNVSNRYKGKVRIPKNVYYMDYKGTMAAGVVNDKKHPFFGTFIINKNHFQNINETLKENIETLIDLDYIHKKQDGALTLSNLLVSDEMQELLNKFQRNELKSFDEIVHLQNYCIEASRTGEKLLTQPFQMYKNIISNLPEGVTIKAPKTLEELSQSGIEEQKKYLIDTIKGLRARNVAIQFELRKQSPFNTIYHEMGHVQDMVARVPASGKFNDPSKYPEKLVEWLSDEKNMQLASEVSRYATTGPGEFIAETYSTIMNGNKLEDIVLELYRKLNGPELPIIS